MGINDAGVYEGVLFDGKTEKGSNPEIVITFRGNDDQRICQQMRIQIGKEPEYFEGSSFSFSKSTMTTYFQIIITSTHLLKALKGSVLFLFNLIDFATAIEYPKSIT